MKNILKNIALGAIVLTASAACADMLDTAPSNQISSGNMWTTPELAQKRLEEEAAAESAE